MLVDLAGAAIQIEQGVVDRDEVADLRDEFNDTASIVEPPPLAL